MVTRQATEREREKERKRETVQRKRERERASDCRKRGDMYAGQKRGKESLSQHTLTVVSQW